MLAAWVLLVCAVGLVVATVTLSDAVTLGGLRQAIRAAPPADRIVSVRLPVKASGITAIDGEVRPALTATLAPAGGEVAAIARAGGLVVAARSGQASGAPGGTLLASFEHLPSHAALVSGHWPSGGARPVEATVSEGAAAALGLRVGDRLTVADSLDAARAVDVVIVGVLRPAADDPYWAGSGLEITGTDDRGGIVTRGPLLVDQSDLIAVAPRDVDLEWRLLPAVDAVRTDDIAPLETAVTSLPDRLGAELPVTQRPTVTTGLPAILAGLEGSMLATRTSVLLLALQFAILAGYAIVLVAGVLVDRRRDEARILRARGAGGSHLALMALIEAALLAVAAAIVAPLVAVAAVAAIGSAGLLGRAVAPAVVDSSLLLTSALLAAACIPVLVLPTLAFVAAPSGLRPGRALTTTLPQRIGIDLILVVLAVVALWQLGRYGAPLTRDARGVLGVDPLLVGAPAIGLLAGAVLAVRAVPRLGELIERALARTRGLTGALGGRQLGRRPLRYSRVALLLILAVAFGTYAIADAATWFASQADQAAYRTVGDIRIRTGSSGTPTTPGSVLRAIPGVTAAVPVIHGSATAGTLRDGELLAVDPAAAARLGAEGWATGTTAALVAGHSAAESVPLPPTVQRLAVTVDADLTADPSGGSIEPGWRGIGLSVVIVDGDGAIHRLSGGDASFDGGRQRIEVALDRGPGTGTTDATTGTATTGPAALLARPVRLLAVELTVSVPAGSIPSGVVDVRSIESSDTSAGGPWTDIGDQMAPPGWTWSRSDTSGAAAYEPPAADPMRLVFPLVPPFSGAPGDFVEGTPAVLRLAPRSGSSEALPAIASPAFLSATGTVVGDEMSIRADAVPLSIRIVGSADRVSPLDPTAPWIVVDAPSLALRRFLDTGDTLAPVEWWLAVKPGTEASVLATLRAPGSAADALGRAELTDTLRRDPVAIGLIAALALGALAAAAFAIIGFLVSVTASSTERSSEFALLEALGLSAAELRAGLLLDQGFVLIVGLVGGLLLGLILAWFVLPVAILTPDGKPPVPTPTVVVPSILGVPLVAAAALLLVVAVAVAVRSVRRRPTAELLRDWGD